MIPKGRSQTQMKTEGHCKIIQEGLGDAGQNEGLSDGFLNKIHPKTRLFII